MTVLFLKVCPGGREWVTNAHRSTTVREVSVQLWFSLYEKVTRRDAGKRKRGNGKWWKSLLFFFFWTCSTSFFTQLLLHIRGLSPSSLSLFSFWVGGFSVSRTRCVSLFPIPVVLKENGERKGGAREHKSNFLRSSACIKTAVVTTDTQTHTHARHEKNNKSALIGEARRRRHFLFLNDQRKKEKKKTTTTTTTDFWPFERTFHLSTLSKQASVSCFCHLPTYRVSSFFVETQEWIERRKRTKAAKKNCRKTKEETNARQASKQVVSVKTRLTRCFYDLLNHNQKEWGSAALWLQFSFFFCIYVCVCVCVCIGKKKRRRAPRRHLRE